ESEHVDESLRSGSGIYRCGASRDRPCYRESRDLGGRARHDRRGRGAAGTVRKASDVMAEVRTMSGNDASARFWWANLALWLAYLLINLVLASNYANWSGGVVMIFVLLSASLYL